MQLTKEDIAEFQELYERKFSQRIDKQEAQAKAISLIRLMEIVYRPLTDDEVRIAKAASVKIGQLPT
jgi:hypothetical protein